VFLADNYLESNRYGLTVAELFDVHSEGFISTYLVMVYTSCLKGCLIYGSETRPMKLEQEMKFKRAEMSTIRWICSFTVKEKGAELELVD